MHKSQTAGVLCRRASAGANSSWGAPGTSVNEQALCVSHFGHIPSGRRVCVAAQHRHKLRALMAAPPRPERSPDVGQRLPTIVILPALFTGIWSVLCAALLHHGCFDISPPFPSPVPSTPRAEFCDSINSAIPWISLTVFPTALVAVLAWVNRRHPRRVALFALCVCLLLIANAIIANSLTYSIGLR
jgi:hypothetical protein